MKQIRKPVFTRKWPVIRLWMHQHMLWLCLLFICFLIQLLFSEADFRFDRQLIEQGQIWRLLTGHLTHLNWSHFYLNMAGLAMVTFFFASHQTVKYWISALLIISAGCSLGLMLDGQLDRYVGFSGVLHGLFIIGGGLEYKKYRTSGLVILILMISKIIWEQTYGALPASESMTGGKIALNAHLYGALSGGVFLCLSHLVVKFKH